MRYWFFDEKSRRATGPHLDMVLIKQPGFGPESKIAPEGARKSHEWKPAKDFPEFQALFAPPPPPGKPKPRAV